MPPMYVNIGAWVGEGTLIDSHALVGSCAQIGNRVHISAAAQIGGVLEPVGALPVIVEDDVLIGGNCGVYEGAVIKKRAVLAAGTILTGSTPLYDLDDGEIIRAAPGEPLVVPEGAVVVPGTRPVIRTRQGLGAVGGDADHRQVPRREDQCEDGARRMDSLTALAFARELIDIDSTTGREARRADWLADRLRDAGIHGRGAAASTASGSTCSRHLDPPEVVLSTHYDCVPSLYPQQRARWRALRAWRVRREGHPRRTGGCRRASACRGDRRVGLLFVVGEERGSEGATLANHSPSGSKFLVNGEPTDSMMATGTRGILRVRLHARGRAGHSSAPEHFESAIEKLLDALVRLRVMRLPSDPVFGTTSYSVGLISGGVAPNVVPPKRRPR